MNTVTVENAEWLSKRKNASVQESPHLPITIEIHWSLWSEEFEKYSCRDFCVGGKVYENPEILTNTHNYVKEAIGKGHFIVSPVPFTYFRDRDVGLSGYIYAYDTDQGMRVGYQAGEYRQRTKTRR
jgi:hypothetical protein